MVRRYLNLVLAAVLVVAFSVSVARADDDALPADDGFLRGKLLVATARIGDPRFSQTVIYMIRHDAEGAMGLVVNRAYGVGPLNTLLKGFGIDTDDAQETVRLHYGDPGWSRAGASPFIPTTTRDRTHGLSTQASR